MSLAKKISTRPSIDSVKWLLATALTQVYNAKEQIMKKEIRKVNSGEKRNTYLCGAATVGDERHKNIKVFIALEGREGCLQGAHPHRLPT